MSDRIRLLGFLFIAYHVAALLIWTAFIAFILGAGVVTGEITPSNFPSDGDAAVLALFFVFIAVVCTLGVTFLGVIVGWGLMRLRPWARILGLVVAVLMLCCFPFGTALGIFAIVTLLGERADRSFSRYRYDYRYGY